MKYYEFVVCKDGLMMGSYTRKAEAIEYAKNLIAKYPDQEVSINAHVYGVPVARYDAGDHYLYSYDVNIA